MNPSSLVRLMFMIIFPIITSGINSLVENEDRINILIATRDTSGSTFFGELIQSWSPGTFYTYEPLIAIKHHHYSGPFNNDRQAFDHLNRIFSCNFNKNKIMEAMFRKFHQRAYPYIHYNKLLVSHLDKKLLSRGKVDGKIYSTSNEVCKEAKVNLVKITRLRMFEVGKFIDQLDPKLRSYLKVIFLFRDPRGVYSSRKRRNFCQDKCRDPKEICADAEQNLKDYEIVKRKYPNQVSFVKYEDISRNPMGFSREFFQNSLNLTMNDGVEKFIETHTKNADHQTFPWSTVRRSDWLTFVWTERLNKKEISSFDDYCKDAFNISGYKSYEEGIKEGTKLDRIDWTKSPFLS